MLKNPADIQVLEEAYPEAVFVKLDGLEGALLGVCERETDEPVLLYCEEAILDILEKENGWVYSEALDWYDYNVRITPGVAFLSMMR